MTLRQLLDGTEARATRSIVLLVVILTGLIEWSGGVDGAVEWFRLGGLHCESFVSSRGLVLLTHGFLHGGWFHAATNVVMTLVLGARVEWWWGARRMLTIFFGGIIAGGIVHLLLSGDQQSLLVGCSGGVMALLLAVTTSDPDSRFSPLPLSGRNMGRGVLLSSLLLTVFHPAREQSWLAMPAQWLQSMAGESIFSWGHACHLGGALFGWIFVRYSLRLRKRAAKRF